MRKSLLIIMMAMIGLSSMAQGYEIGDKVKDFRLMNVDGRMVSLSDYDNLNGVIVIFTCNHCPYSVAYEDRIIALHSQFAPQGYPVVAINPNDPAVQAEDSFDNMKKRAMEKDFAFAYLFDKGQKVYPEFGATRTPHVFILENRESYFELAYVGAIDDNYQNEDSVEEKFVENAVNDLLEGNDPSTTFTKAIGCTIKKRK